MRIQRLSPLPLLCSGVLFVTMIGCGPESDPSLNHHPGADMTVGLTCTKPPKDSDGDLISDENEGASSSRDTDGDGIPDYKDTDSDNDGIPDAIEGRNGNACTPPVDSDSDGKPDYLDLDSDDALDATVPDHVEAGASLTSPVDTNGDGKPDYLDPDDDGDGILDILEMTPQGSAIPAKDLLGAPDTDHDGTPDFLDLDSDGDYISDLDERGSDLDGDLVPNYRDTDADGDCVPDIKESGDNSLSTPAVDSDGDGAPDFADVDSDNDGLTDGAEDRNCNGSFDACETDRLVTDSDGDGVSDLVEVVACNGKSVAVQLQTICVCDGASHDVSPTSRGDFVFIEAYQAAPSPKTQVLSLSDDVNQADVLFAMDTTGSMQQCIDNLKSGLANLVTQVTARIANPAFGAYEFRDLGAPQNDPSSNPPNLPSFRYAQRVETVTASGLAAVQSALQTFEALQGGDGPEAGWDALYTLANGALRTIQVLTSQTYGLATDPSTLPLSTGETGGTIGGAGFRAGSVPIIVTVTDAEWHDAPGSFVAADSESGRNTYPSTVGFNSLPACDPCTNAPSRREAINALNTIGAHVIGLAARGATTVGDPKARAIKVALETGAVVGPGDFGGFGTRPIGCPTDQCCTGLDSSDLIIGEPPQGGVCPLAFTVDGDNGTGVSNAIVSGIVALSLSLRFDVHVEASDVDANTINNFLLRLVPDVSGLGAASVCITSPPSPLQDDFTGPRATSGADGVLDTFPGLKGGNKVCFDVIPKMNTTVTPTAQPQLFRASLQVRGVSGSSTVNLGTPREVYFLVPPKIVNAPIQ